MTGDLPVIFGSQTSQPARTLQRSQRRAREGGSAGPSSQSGGAMGLEGALDALLERLNLAKYKEVMEENEVR